jgi:uncharacterized protein
MRQQGEPSVEEILESIKQVIARDNRVGAAEVRRQRETDGLPDAASLDQGRGHGKDDILDLSVSAEYLDDTPQPSPEAGPNAEDAPLLTREARSSMRESLAALALLSEPGAQPKIVRSGETSLEGLVRELLRPALAEWLEANLPPIVERMVADEIRKISTKKG